jgi:hypothetical protein
VGFLHEKEFLDEKLRSEKKIKKILKIKKMGLDDWFGEEDIVWGKEGRSFRVVCESERGVLLQIPKNIVTQRILNDQHSVRNVKRRVA